MKSKEDPRFLTGHATFIDDIKLPRMLYAAILRSPHIHTKITRLEVTKALKGPSVETAIKGGEVVKIMKPLPYTRPDIPLAEYTSPSIKSGNKENP